MDFIPGLLDRWILWFLVRILGRLINVGIVTMRVYGAASIGLSRCPSRRRGGSGLSRSCGTTTLVRLRDGTLACLCRLRRRASLSSSSSPASGSCTASSEGHVCRNHWWFRHMDGADGERMLNDRFRGARSGHATIEDRLRRLAARHGFGNSIGLLLILITRLADAARNLRAVTLLHHVRGFVRGEFDIRGTAERDAVADGIS